jgi:hypothetical protein
VSEQLVRYLEREGRALSQRVLQEMYRDPFWSERFGDRGRRHADEDSDYHLKYLARALANGEAYVLVRYAVWLREVLATRGMCTRHLDENFRLLAVAIVEQPWPAREQAVALLTVAREALLHEGGEARRLQERIDPLAREVVAAFRERRPHGWKRDARGRGALEDDAANYLSYVADALAMGSPDTLVEHTRWLAAHVRAHSATQGDMAVFLAAVQGVLAPLPQAAAFVEAAQSALGVAA